MQILPSAREPASGLTLAPFRGLRYARGRVSGLAEVTSPPYDVIAHDIEGRLLAADPHNVVRLILPRPAQNPDGDEYTEAARLLQAWLDDGILLPDDQPALYVYEQSSRPADPAGAPAPAVLQRGLIGALGLGQPGRTAVLPHEDVLPGPVTGRRRLMEATGANLEPIFLLYDGAGASAATRLTMEVAEQREPLLCVDTDDGLRHRLWAITDPAEHATVAADLAPRQALIADGHHRHAAYLEIQARKRAEGAGPGPWDSGLALLVDSAAYPPRIGPIHRVVRGVTAAGAAAKASGAFTVRALPAVHPGGAGRPASAAAVHAARHPALAALARASRDGPALLIAGDDGSYLLTDPDPAQVEAAMPGRSPRWRRLPASVLQELLLARVLETPDADPLVSIHHDAAAAVREAGRTGGTAVLCPPMAASAVHELAARGERVPRKSTSFGPKPRTGLVIRSFAHG